jgi:hypothetical protein
LPRRSRAGHLVQLQVTDNFHEVVPGTLYRSAQLSANELAAHVRAHAIRSVVNLRAESRDDPWYDSEVVISRDLGLVHLDFRMTAVADRGRAPRRADA